MTTASPHIEGHSPSIEELMEALVSSSIDAIIAIDHEKKIVKFNPQAEQLLGWKENELLGQSVASLHDDLGMAREIHRNIQQHGTIENCFLTLLHRDGSRIPISLSARQIVDKHGNKLGQVGYLRDRRRVKMLEARLSALIETSKVINGTLEVGQILEHVVREAIRAIPMAEAGSIHRFDEATGLLGLQVCSFDYSQEARDALRLKPGDGIAGWVFQTQEPVLTGDAQADPRYKAIPNAEVKPHRSMLCAPITSKSRQIGVISLSSSSSTDAFTRDDLDLLVGFSDQAAIAIENAEHLSELKAEAQELKLLRSVSMNINKQTEVYAILSALLEGGNQLLNTEMAVVHWWGRDEGKLRTVTAPVELEELTTAPRLDTDTGLTAEIIRTCQPVVVPDTTTDPRVNPSVLDKGIKSLVGYPLTLSGKVAGVLFFNSQKRQYFDEDKRRLISWLLPLAAAAIENADFIERLERTKNLSDALKEVSSELARTQDFTEQMNALKNFVQTHLKAPMFYLGLYDKDTQELHVEIQYEEFVDQEPFVLSLKGKSEWSIAGYVIQNRSEIVWVSDEQKQEDCRRLGINPVKKGLACKTCVALPLEVEGQMLGIASIQSQESRAWDDIEISTFRTLAHQASIAIRNARLREQLRKVSDTALKVAENTARGNLQTTLETVVNGIKFVLDCNIVTLWVYREDKDIFDPEPTVAGLLREPGEMSRTRRVDRSATPFKIIQKDAPYVAQDTQQDLLLGSPFAIREHVCSSMAIPLKTESRRVGVLFINYCYEKHTFTQEELAIIQLFSLQAAVAIRNAMLFEDEQDRRRVLRIIDDAGRIVTGFLQLDEIFENLAQQAYEISGERGRIASFATITLVEGRKTVVKAIYPPEERKNLAEKGLAEIDLDKKVDGRIGIIGRAVESRKDMLVKNVDESPDFLRSNPDTRCEMAVPIIYRDEVLGVINVEHKVIGGIDEDDLQDTRSLAAHAAVAIQNARMFERLQRKNDQQQAIYEASKKINESMACTEEELLETLVHQMVKRIAPHEAGMQVLGAIHLFDKERQELRLAAICPADAFGEHRIGEIIHLTAPARGRIGITGRTVTKKETQLVADVSTDEDYLGYSEFTRCELAVPLLDGEQALGVLSLESSREGGFDEETVEAMEAFADLAAIALVNTRRYQQLLKARSMVGNITAVAWMGLIAGGWRHAIGNMATIIVDLTLHAQSDLEKGKPAQKVIERLELIRDQVREIQKSPMPPLSGEAGVEPIHICQLVRERVSQFKAKKQYADIEFQMDFQVEELTCVRASPEWIRRILDILIDNAKNALKGRPVKRLRTEVCSANEGVEILLTDTGRGIPKELIPLLFNEPVKKQPHEKGSGIGLFLARTVIETYGGRLEIRRSDADGTTMVMWLPIMR